MKNRSWLILVSVLAALLGGSGCKTDAYCFVCEHQKDATTPDVQGTGGQTGFFDGNTGTGGSVPDAGDAQACSNTQTDPQNCGTCGNVCSFPGAIAKCVAGQCVQDHCASGLVDTDPSKPGCECTLTNTSVGADGGVIGVEICDGVDNDCDLVVDNGFNLATDVNNCGACNVVCPTLPNSAVACVPDTTTVGRCDYTCNTGFTNLSGVKSEIGCPYQCPVFPTVAEVCNGVDDDCNGVIDDGNPGAGVACSDNCPIDTATGLHSCRGVCTQGVTSCTGTTAGIVCVGGGGVTGEICDGLDNDCDGVVDNGFDLQTDPLHCGKCSIQCQAGDLCVAGLCQFVCQPGYKDIDNNPANGCEYACPVFPTTAETCNNIDDDCNGLIDDSVTGVGGPCTGNCPSPNSCVTGGNCSPYAISPNNGTCYGVCSSGGTLACVAGASVCQYATERATELCNGLDDNCDGRVDEGFDLTQDPLHCGSCTNACSAPNAQTITCTSGACSSIVTCSPGYADLNKTLSDGCEYQCPVFPSVGETCNGLDDDCDGVVDNNLTGFGFDGCTRQCPLPNACVTSGTCTVPTSTAVNGCYGVCGSDGVDVCQSGVKVCTHPARTLEICNGLDDNCDGRIDENFNKATDVNNCGTCGNVCSLPNATGVQCVGGTCQATVCASGYLLQNGNCNYKCPVFPTQPETCNGVDDNCDGIVDNNPTDLVNCAENCPGGIAGDLTSCKGLCNNNPTRLYVCQSGQRICQGGYTPQLEVCDNQDNDCDGTVDNGFNKQTDPLNCGACNNKCALPNVAVDVCVGGICGVGTCAPGFGDLNQANNNVDGCEYTCPVYPTTTETCNGKDDDCDGLVDAADPDLVTPANFCQTGGPCTGAAPICCSNLAAPGTLDCPTGVTGRRCSYSANVDFSPVTGTVLVNETRCDGIDNNCNGQIDEAFPLKGTACTVGTGICAGGSTYICSGDKLGVTCPASATAGNARDEDCNGLDDNCDGQVDERNPNLTGLPQCTKDVTGATVAAHDCLGWKDPMVALGATGVYVYSYEAARPDSSSTAAGFSGARACSKPSRIPWTSVTEADAAAACAAVKDSLGNPMRLCAATEWETACEAAVGVTTTPLWSYASSPGTYVAGTCNDNSDSGKTCATGADCMSGICTSTKCVSAAWPTAKGASCYANWSSTDHVYDMSGNVAEWTSTTATVGTTTYNRVRGGSYSSFGSATRCDFNFVLEQQSYQNFDLGFRCCSDAAP